MDTKPVYYRDYLQLDKILNAQTLQSELHGAKAHDETLFIIIHQAYELWFKQILTEIESITDIFSKDTVPEQQIAVAVGRLHRINRIFELLVQQFGILETMTSLDFMDFRDFLHPASGFQSAQFRVLETTLGLLDSNRVNPTYVNNLDPSDAQKLTNAASKPSLFELVERWLEKMPFQETENYTFWKDYKKVIQATFEKDRNDLRHNSYIPEPERNQSIERINKMEEGFNALFDPNLYAQITDRRMSQRATLATIFISLYREYPLLQLPFQFLNSLIEMDENFTLWRYRHSIMTSRMIGARIGTGGSSGSDYLAKTSLKQRVFVDIKNVSGMLIPRSAIPPLPNEIAKELSFVFEL
ncbi:MAG: tryptophan 2,3-dioxygenase [Ignavibacteriae bacterium]|nr:tryptophan 2,3-dioxygenase [Ignavibacteriota bacterium]